MDKEQQKWEKEHPILTGILKGLDKVVYHAIRSKKEYFPSREQLEKELREELGIVEAANNDDEPVAETRDELLARIKSNLPDVSSFTPTQIRILRNKLITPPVKIAEKQYTQLASDREKEYFNALLFTNQVWTPSDEYKAMALVTQLPQGTLNRDEQRQLRLLTEMAVNTNDYFELSRRLLLPFGKEEDSTAVGKHNALCESFLDNGGMVYEGEMSGPVTEVLNQKDIEFVQKMNLNDYWYDIYEVLTPEEKVLFSVQIHDITEDLEKDDSKDKFSRSDAERKLYRLKQIDQFEEMIQEYGTELAKLKAILAELPPEVAEAMCAFNNREITGDELTKTAKDDATKFFGQLRIISTGGSYTKKINGMAGHTIAKALVVQLFHPERIQEAIHAMENQREEQEQVDIASEQACEPTV